MWFMLRKRENGIWKREGEGTENKKMEGKVDANGEDLVGHSRITRPCCRTNLLGAYMIFFSLPG
jgi:hypothetical protein